MKKITFLLTFLFASVSLFAQYTLEDADGNEIMDGAVLEFGAYTAPWAKYDFFVNNDTSDPINVKIEFVGATNADGSLFELCWGLCYTSIMVGNSYPLGNDWVTIDGNGQSLPGNHLFNQSDGGGNSIDYEFRFHLVDNSGNDIGSSKTVTYRYDPLLSIGDLNISQVELQSTVVNETLNVQSPVDVDAVIYNVRGQQVAATKLAAGNQQFDVSALASQAYLVVFTDDSGASKTVKFIKR
ncbi:MAG: T9SS type A sorting domain-containing protein [Flavobacteriaceae bacterium]|nr:T9SS type A sorting domain-containing protein [Flavobacteriaceae bacterium]